MKERLNFEEAVAKILKKDERYSAEAYEFVRQSLDATITQLEQEKNSGHLTAHELYFGSCMLAVKEYGPLAGEVLKHWGIENCTDIGAIVYNLIDVGIFGKQNGDTKEEFDDLPDLMTLLDKPFISEIYEEN